MSDWLVPLNNLAGGLFLLAAFALVATRQMRGALRFFVYQSLCLVASAVLIGVVTGIRELYVIAAINLVSKPLLIPLLLRRTMPERVRTRREIELAVTVPSALLIALGIAIFSYFVGRIILVGSPPILAQVNVPVGIAGLLIGAYTITVRREAVPQLLGLLSMENGAFFVGIAFAPDLPVIAELAAAFDSLLIVTLVSILARAIHLRVGTTAVGALTALKEERSK